MTSGKWLNVLAKPLKETLTKSNRNIGMVMHLTPALSLKNFLAELFCKAFLNQTQQN